MEEKVTGHDIGYKILDFTIRNSFGLLCFLSGLTYQIYQMSGKTKRLSRPQCIMAVTLWAISGITVVIALSDLAMNKLMYGLICWATPIVIKPFADKVAEKSPGLSEKVVGWIDALLERKKKENESN